MEESTEKRPFISLVISLIVGWAGVPFIWWMIASAEKSEWTDVEVRVAEAMPIVISVLMTVLTCIVAGVWFYCRRGSEE